jgi:uncharacterized metal-binding protein YceD (DUF177 family)
MGKEFFAAYETSEIEDAAIEVQVTLLKHTQFLEVDFQLKGWVEVVCDKCLDPLSIALDTEAKLYVKFSRISNEDDDSDDDVIILSQGENEFNVAHYLYEYAHLGLPIRRVHPDDEAGKSTCNQEMIRQLNQYLVDDRDSSEDN